MTRIQPTVSRCYTSRLPPPPWLGPHNRKLKPGRKTSEKIPAKKPPILVENPRPATKPATREKNPRPATISLSRERHHLLLCLLFVRTRHLHDVYMHPYICKEVPFKFAMQNTSKFAYSSQASNVGLNIETIEWCFLRFNEGNELKTI